MNISKLLLASAVVAFAGMATAATAQDDYPSKPIRLVIAFSPGGSIDALGRMVATEMEKNTGQPVLVENIGGAGGVVGTEVVASSPPDGYTLALVSPGAVTVAAGMGRELAYDPRELTPVVNLASYVPVLIAREGLEPQTLEEVLAYARANPGVLSYAVSGIGSSTHIMGELFREAAQLDMVAIPFAGGGEVMQGLLTGDVDLAVTSYTTVQAQVEAGQVRVVAAFDTDRYHAFDYAPTITESLPDFIPPVIWFGVFGPPGLPAEIAARFNEEAIKAMQAPHIVEQFDRLGYEAIGGTPEDFAEFLAGDFEVMGAAAEIAGLKDN